MALQMAAFARDAGHNVLIGAPEDNAYTAKAKAQGFQTHIYQAPDSLLVTGGEVFKQSILKKIIQGLYDFTPYQWRTHKAIQRQNIDWVYMAQQRGVLQIGPAAKLSSAKVMWHVQSGLRDDASFLNRASAALSQKIICVSHAVKDDVIKRAPKSAAHKISVLHNGLPDIKPQLDKSDTPKTHLLFAANITPHKGAHILIEAINKLPAAQRSGIRVDIAGWVLDEDYEAHLQRLITEYDLDDTINMHGYCEDIPPLIQRADIMICPSLERGEIEINGQQKHFAWKEGFNLSALEAMRAGAAVICSASYGLTEVVEDGVTGLHVPPGNASELASAIERLVKDKETTQEMGSQGRARYEALFTQEHMRSKFVKILEDLK